MIDENLRKALLDQHQNKEKFGHYTTRYMMECFGKNNRYSSGKLLQEGDIMLSFCRTDSKEGVIIDGEIITLRIDEIEEYARQFEYVGCGVLGAIYAKKLITKA